MEPGKVFVTVSIAINFVWLVGVSMTSGAGNSPAFVWARPEERAGPIQIVPINDRMKRIRILPNDLWSDSLRTLTANHAKYTKRIRVFRVVRGQKIRPPNSTRSHRRTGCYMAPSAASEGVLGLGSGVWIRSPASGLCGRIRARRSLAPPSEGGIFKTSGRRAAGHRTRAARFLPIRMRCLKACLPR